MKFPYFTEGFSRVVKGIGNKNQLVRSHNASDILASFSLFKKHFSVAENPSGEIVQLHPDLEFA